MPIAVSEVMDAVQNSPREEIEINNSRNVINNEGKNIENPSRIEAPKVKEIIIQAPKAEGKKRPEPAAKPASAFVF